MLETVKPHCHISTGENPRVQTFALDCLSPIRSINDVNEIFRFDRLLTGNTGRMEAFDKTTAIYFYEVYVYATGFDPEKLLLLLPRDQTEKNTTECL